MDPANGLIIWSTQRATCGLVVEGGRVVDCAPYVRRWAMGADARELWRAEARKKGLTLTWLPDGR